MLLVVFVSIKAKAQIITVRDNATREPIKNTIIKDKYNKSVVTNNKGQASLTELDKSDSLHIYNIGYYSKKTLATENNTNIYLSARMVMLDEIVFSANKSEEKKTDVPYTIEVIKQKDIEFGNQPTSAELLQNTGAVFVQKSQMGGGSPILRGFEANKTLIVVDGVRMNNAIYRGGHLQDVITLDANMLERTEVIFGPSSTMYGSDALGGVMHFYTKNAEFSSDDKLLVKANTFARYSSATNENTGHIDLNIGLKKFASMTNVTYSKFGDLMSGSTKLNGYYGTGWDRPYYVERINNRDTMLRNANDNLQKGSGYDQLDVMQKFAIKTGDHLSHNINIQYSQSGNINRYDRLTERSNSLKGADPLSNKYKFAEWYYGPQKRLMAAYTLNYDAKTIFTDNIKLILAYQKIDQDRISRRFQTNNRTTQMEDVTVLSANIDAFKEIKEKHELHYGFEVTSNDVKSTANSFNLATNTKTTAATRYADGGNTMSTAAVYVTHAWEISDNFIITDGIRYTYNTLKSTFKDTSFFKFPFKTAEQNNSAITGNLGFTWKADNDYKVSLLANTGFRTPNVDDMSKVFESSGSFLIVPNNEIKPEYAYNFEMNISKVFQGKYKFDLTGFYSMLENALVLRDFKLNGKDSATFNGVKTKVQAMQNADRAYIYGVSAGVQFDFNEHISFKSIINYTYGRYIISKQDTVVPLDHIPPVFGQSSLVYKNKNTDAEFFIRYNGKKTLADYSTSGEDNLQYATPNGMPAWFTLNIRAGYSITKNLRLNIACENITDNRYRVFASGINAPGRNFIVSLRFKM